MQTQGIAALFGDFAGHLKDAATELKCPEENKIRMLSAVVSQRHFAFKGLLKFGCYKKDLLEKAN